mmetsp:Transcript_45530/g.132536  ORF Transcript_45530/g.132536 Transcript_45530/m.132536 type:complete len:328 (-) Transcript_45530:443-1426(-)
MSTPTPPTSRIARQRYRRRPPDRPRSSPRRCPPPPPPRLRRQSSRPPICCIRRPSRPSHRFPLGPPRWRSLSGTRRTLRSLAAWPRRRPRSALGLMASSSSAACGRPCSTRAHDSRGSCWEGSRWQCFAGWSGVKRRWASRHPLWSLSSAAMSSTLRCWPSTLAQGQLGCEGLCLSHRATAKATAALVLALHPLWVPSSQLQHLLFSARGATCPRAGSYAGLWMSTSSSIPLCAHRARRWRRCRPSVCFGRCFRPLRMGFRTCSLGSAAWSWAEAHASHASPSRSRCWNGTGTCSSLPVHWLRASARLERPSCRQCVRARAATPHLR